MVVLAYLNRVFISEWLYFRLLQRKKRRRRSARTHLYGH
jgi:hypothetical protein